MRKVAFIVGGAVIILIVAGGAFYGGMMYERSQQASIRSRFFAERGGLPGGTPQPGAGNVPQGQAGFGRGASGTVKSIQGDTLLLSTAQDVTTVILNDQTGIRKTVAGQIADLQPGQRVVVTGDRAQDGTITATSIQILPVQP